MLKAKRKFFNERAGEWKDSLDRRQEDSLLHILDSLELAGELSILDIGSGNGVLAPYLINEKHLPKKLVHLDIAEQMLFELNKKYSSVSRSVCADGAVLPFANNSFDRVICFSVFPHFDDKPGVLTEIKRVLKPGALGTIAHVDSSDTLNKMHKSLESAVAGDMLPPVQRVKKMIAKAGLKPLKTEEHEGLYLAVFQK
jgi:demethylmenaquinone methyltransferase/2-methoxy-6-polyprenyl-1,4-benzoquinol methylase